jgi:hypothetical protein
MATASRPGNTRAVTSNGTYRVLTTEGKTVGHVAGESERAFVVECGAWPRKTLHALPRKLTSVGDEGGSLVMQVSKEMLAKSPKLEPGAPVDDQAVASWWDLD